MRYHVKMDKLLQKEAKVTKVPDDTYGEREREREREREGGGVCTQPFHPSLCRPAKESTSVSKIFRKILVCEVSPFESKQYAL